MEAKRGNSNLIPYKIKDNVIFVYLQKRDGTAKVLPDHYSFFGGKGEEGETKEQTLVREIKEELNFDVTEYEFLGGYPSTFKADVVLNTFFAKVPDNFDEMVNVQEGQYGKFLSEEEVLKEPKLIDSDKKIIKDFYERIRSENP